MVPMSSRFKAAKMAGRAAETAAWQESFGVMMARDGGGVMLPGRRSLGSALVWFEMLAINV